MRDQIGRAGVFGRVKSFTADVVSQEMARMGFDNRILCQFTRLSYIRQPAAHIPG
jgi:hypothetical protein